MRSVDFDDAFVPWWQGFKAYWAHWKEESFYRWSSLHAPGRSFQIGAIGWVRVIRTPLAMIHIAKCGQSYNRDGYESGIAISWLPKRWSLRLREAEEMYRYKREWMSFIPRVAIWGLR